MTKEISVNEVKVVKNGVGPGGKPWTLYHVVAVDGIRYSTFEEKYLDAIGKKIVVNVESKPSTKLNPNTGKPYLNWSIVEPKKGAMSPEITTKLFDKLERIEKKIDLIFKEIEVPKDELSESNPEDLPF